MESGPTQLNCPSLAGPTLLFWNGIGFRSTLAPSIVYSGEPGIDCTATTPQGLIDEGIYKEVAIALHTPPHRAVSLALVAHALGATKDVTDVFSRSLLPFVVEHLLGGPIPRHNPNGQIALRFPGEFCQPPGSFNTPYLAQHLTHWHIDGCATDHAPDQQHYGTIKNFSVLVGVLCRCFNVPGFRRRLISLASQ